MAITYVNGASPTSTTNTTQCSITIPSETQTDDILILVTANRDATTDPVITDNDSGGNTWAKIAGNNNTGSGDVWWKRATSGTASKVVDSKSNTGSCSAVLGVFRGVTKAVTPYEGAVANANASGTEIHNAITPTRNGSMVCLCIVNLNNDNACSSEAATSPSTITERVEHLNTGGSDCATVLCAAIQSTAGSTGQFSWSQTNGITVSIAFALIPAWDPITADAGSYAETGTAATLKAGRKITVDAVAFNVQNGVGVSLSKGYPLSAGSGSFVMSGIDAGLRYNRLISANSGSYSESGTNVVFILGKIIAALAGGYSITGSTVSLLQAKLISAISGAYSVNGTVANLLATRLIIAAAGSYAITGQDATLAKGRTITTDSGTYNISGISASLIATRKILSDAGSYIETGINASLLTARLLTALAGTFNFTGTDADLIYDTGGENNTKFKQFGFFTDF